MWMIGAVASVTVAVQGPAVSPGAQTPPLDGVAVAELVIDAGGAALTVAVTV
jgi:hypothetical protein